LKLAFAESGRPSDYVVCVGVWICVVVRKRAVAAVDRAFKLREEAAAEGLIESVVWNPAMAQASHPGATMSRLVTTLHLACISIDLPRAWSGERPLE
jgi:hypothetical protein